MSAKPEAMTWKCSKCQDRGQQFESDVVMSDEYGIMPGFCACDTGAAKRDEWMASDLAKEKRDEIRREKRDWAFRFCRIGKRFEGATIKNLKSPLLELATEYVDRWEDLKSKGKGLYFWGNVGSGKTYTAVAIAHEIMERHLAETMYFSFTDLMGRVREKIGEEEGDKERLLERAKKCELLVIDDLGLEKATEWVAEQLYMIVNARYEAMLPMIVTSNQSPEDLAAMHNPQIASRLLEMSRTVRFSGGDRRVADRTLFPAA